MISRLYFKKNEVLASACRGKTVLDLGAIDHDAAYEQRKNWLHGDLKRTAGEITGTDIDRKAIKTLREREYNIIFADAERFNLNKKFEVIVAGDLIEHLNNVGGFLSCVKRHMNQNSAFILTTPNCLSLSNWLELLIFGRIKYFNEEHTHWYDESTLKKALENAGFEIIELSFMVHNPHFIGESKLRSMLKNIRQIMRIGLCLLRKQLAPTIFVRARLR